MAINAIDLIFNDVIISGSDGRISSHFEYLTAGRYDANEILFGTDCYTEHTITECTALK